MSKDITKVTGIIINQATGGLLDSVKAIIKTGAESGVDEKIRDFTNHLKKNNISENEILKHIKKMAQWEKDIFFTIIQRTIFSENPIKRFLLAKIWFYQIKHEQLDYFHSTLLNNIDLLIQQDYKLIYKIVNQQSDLQNEKIIIRDYKLIEEEFYFTVSKLKSIGLISDFIELPSVEELTNQYQKISTDNYKPKEYKDITYSISKDFHILNKYVSEFFELKHNKT
jgi:hypothetical protein